MNQGNIFIGNGSNVATGVNVSGNGQMLIGNGTTINSVDISGDIDIDNTGDAQIQTDAVTATEIATDAVTTTEIDDGTIATVDIANNAITSGLIADDAVGSTEIATNAVTTTEIADGTIAAADIGSDVITAGEIATGAVTTDEILDGTIATVDIGDDQVNLDKLATGAANQVFTTDGAGNPQFEARSNFASSTLNQGNIFIGNGSNVATGVNVSGNGQMLIGNGTTINSVDISGDIDIDNTGDAQIQADAVTATEIATDAVTTTEIDDGTIATVDIANNAITSGLIADDAVGSTEIATNAVTTTEIADGTIAAADIGADVITAGEIATGAVTTDEIEDATILEADIATNQITSALIADGAVTSSEIADGTVSTNDLGDDQVTIAKLGTAGAGDANRVFTTDGSGNPQLEDRTNFASSTLNDGNIFIGNGTNVATGRTLSGDASISNTGTLTISANAIGSSEITDGSIAAADIGADVITANEIAAGGVTTSEILDGTIAAADIGTDVITANEIAAGAVTSSEILDGTVATADIADDQVTTAKLGTGGVVDASKVFTTDGSGNPQLEDRTNFASSTLNDGNIFIGNGSNVATGRTLSGDATVSTTGTLTISANAIGSSEITDGSIAAADIGADVITANEIATGGVTTAEILNGTITATDIGSDVITASELATGAVATAEILDGTIATIDIGDDQVNLDKLATGAANQVFTTDGAGNPQFEARSNFASSALNDGDIFIGNGSNVATAQTLGGDATISNIGTLTIAADAIGSSEITDGSIAAADIGTLTTVDIDGGTIDGTVINVDDDEFTIIDETSSFQADFQLSGLGANRTYTLPDASGTILVSGTLTGNRALVTDAGGNIVVSPVTDAEIAYLDITAAGTAQASGALVTDASTNISGITNLGATQVDGGNLRIAGNILSSTNTDGDINLTPAGTGTVISSALIDANNGLDVAGNIIVSGDVDGIDVSDLGTNVSNLITLSGLSANSSDLGTFTGDIISDNTTVATALQELETDVDAIQTLSGVAAEATNLGSFTGGTITDGSATIKSALQQLETAVESGSTDDQNASEVPFTPITGITSGNVQDAFGEVLPLAGGSITGDLTIGDNSADVLTINSSFTIIDNFFRIVDDIDASKQVGFLLGNLTTATTYQFRFPDYGATTQFLTVQSDPLLQYGYESDNSILTDGTNGNFIVEGTAGIDLGADANSGAINIGTGAAARIISMGNAAGSTAVNISAGTGGVTVQAPLTNTSETSLNIVGATSLDPTTVAINTNNQVVTVLNRSLIVLDDNENDNTDFTIEDGIKDGQVLVLLLVGTNGNLTLEDNGNARLNGDWTANANGESITLIWYGGFWNELARHT